MDEKKKYNFSMNKSYKAFYYLCISPFDHSANCTTCKRDYPEMGESSLTVTKITLVYKI